MQPQHYGFLLRLLFILVTLIANTVWVDDDVIAVELLRKRVVVESRQMRPRARQPMFTTDRHTTSVITSFVSTTNRDETRPNEVISYHSKFNNLRAQSGGRDEVVQVRKCNLGIGGQNR